MEKQLKFTPLLSLKEMALRRVAVHLYSVSDVSAAISGLELHWFSPLNERRLVRREIIDREQGKVLKLGLPESLTRQMIEICIPIFVLIKRWRDQLEYHLKIKIQEMSLSYSEILCLTPAGLIDYRKTAERLVCCDALDAVQCYKIACFNCLDDYIPLLWEKLSKEKKYYFYEKVRFRKRFESLHFCWPYILKGELSKLDEAWNIPGDESLFHNLTSFNQFAFIIAASNGNKAGTEYFFQKLTHEEKEASLTQTAVEVLFRLDSEIFCYLLSVMNPEQQMATIKAYPICVFKRILDCPLPDFFLENSGLFWSLFPPSEYDNLLQSMLDIYVNFFYPKLFQEFFIQSPPDFKKYFVHQRLRYGREHENNAFRFLSIFLNFEDPKSITVVLRNLSEADRLETMVEYCVLNLFYESMLQDKWHMVKVCLREGLLSQKDREIFKNYFMKFLKFQEPIDIANPKWKTLFEFLDETNANSDTEKKGQKRKLDTCCPE